MSFRREQERYLAEVCVDLERWIEGTDRLLEGEEAVLHVMGEQIASEKRRNRWTCVRGGIATPIRRSVSRREKRRNPCRFGPGDAIRLDPQPVDS
jgi:hypothetical protein